MAVRVVRAMRKLGAAELERLARGALSSTMPRGALLAAVRVPRTADVAEGWDSVTAALPHPPHRTGALLDHSDRTVPDRRRTDWGGHGTRRA